MRTINWLAYDKSKTELLQNWKYLYRYRKKKYTETEQVRIYFDKKMQTKTYYSGGCEKRMCGAPPQLAR